TSQISPNVDVHAIMDDISLTGDAQELSVAVPVMITELAKVGLRINLKKSVVLNCPELAARLGIVPTLKGQPSKSRTRSKHSPPPTMYCIPPSPCFFSSPNKGTGLTPLPRGW
ncbi:Hypothetical protein, putative, partial [Bodo saltans]